MRSRRMSKRIIISNIITSLIILILILLSGKVYAETNLESIIKPTEYTEDYKEWLELSDEERTKTLEPRKYEIVPLQSNSDYLKSTSNALRVSQLLKATLSSNYSLQTVIPENVKIRNQMQTNSCWAFATIGALETNLAMQDKLASKAPIVYDFSERHMNYATTRTAFLNNKINENGFTRELKDGGNFYTANAYLTNGSGAIPESQMKFVNTEEQIDISEIKNKTISTTLLDTVEFEAPNSSTKQELITKMKQHITNYGGIFAGVYGAQVISNNYNNVTGAIYCSNSILTPTNHAVTIIGWDDNFSKDKFNTKCQPDNNGAWIIKNSWGESISESLSELKSQLYEANTAYCNQNNWTSADKIPNEIILAMAEESYGKGKVTIDATNDKIIAEIGNKGYMYVSYDDANIYKTLFGIKRAESKKSYYNIYQNDILGVSGAAKISTREKIYLANVFTRNSRIEEALNKVSIYTLQGYTCKVLVNPNGSSKAQKDLQEVKLAAGDTITVEPGYHTIEFAEPITLTGEKFVVVLEISTDTYSKSIALEVKNANTPWANAIINSGESFYTTNTDIQSNKWTDFATLSDERIKGNVCIKAFTTKDIPKPITLQKIEVTKEPTKTVYTEGQNFDKAGMKVLATYSNGDTKEITNYTITDGNNLSSNKTYVTISYTENGVTKTITQKITVNKKVAEATISKIEIATKPTKLKYTQNKEKLDLTGGKIKATYSDNSTETVDMKSAQVTSSGFDNTKLGKQTIVVSYKQKTATFEVEVVKEQIADTTKAPVSSDFDNATGSAKEIEFRFYKENTNNSYAKMKIKISNIKIGDEDDTYTYYYYLSGTQGDTVSDSDWKKVTATKENDGTYSIIIDVKTSEIKNANEISQSDNMYVYIKEIAEINEKTAQVTKTLKVNKDENTIITFYLDDKNMGSLDEILSQIGGNNKQPDASDNNNNSKEDDTTAKGTIPQTGIVPIITISLFVILLIGGISYYKFRNIDR